MVAQAAPVALRINGQEVTFNPAPNPELKKKDGITNKSNWDFVVQKFRDTGIVYRVFSIGEKVMKLALIVFKDMGSAMAAFAQDLAAKFGLAAAMLGITRLPDVLQKAKKALVQWINPPAEGSIDHLGNLQDVADAGATCGYVALTVTGNPVYRTVADPLGLFVDGVDLGRSADKWLLSKQCAKLVEEIDPKNSVVKERFERTATYNLLSLAKTVCSVFTGVMGLLVLYLNGPVLPPALLLGVGIVGSVCAIWAAFYKDTTAQEIVDFSKIAPPQPKVVVAAPLAAAAG